MLFVTTEEQASSSQNDQIIRASLESTSSSGSCNSSDCEELPSEGPSGAGRNRRHIAWAVLAAYCVLLIFRDTGRGAYEAIAGVSVWDIDDRSALATLVIETISRIVLEFAYFVPLGLVATVAIQCRSRLLRRLPVNLLALGLASVLAVLVNLIGSAKPLDSLAVASLLVNSTGCLFGSWVGTTWLRGWRACLWLIPKTVILVLLLALSAGAVMWLSMEGKPLSFAATEVSSPDKRRLVQLARNQRLENMRPGQIQTIVLTEHDINALLSWALSLKSSDSRATVSLAPTSASLLASIAVTGDGEQTRYLNLAVSGTPRIMGGVLNLGLESCRIGRINLPAWLLSSISQACASLVGSDPLSQPFVEAIRATTIDSDSVEIAYGKVHLPDGFREDLFGPDNSSEPFAACVRAHMENLVGAFGNAPDSEPTFGMCMETVFSFARDRSLNNDPIAENRAAIFTLGIVLGSPRIEMLLRYFLPRRGNYSVPGVFDNVLLRGRADLTKHFCASATISVLSDGLISDAVGLLKEELDTNTAGKGFSFADMMANRAGIAFADIATRNEEAARAIQDRLASGFRVEEFFPSAKGLPEGIGDAELRSRYGGVGGAGYLEQMEEIQRRIAACAAYR